MADMNHDWPGYEAQIQAASDTAALAAVEHEVFGRKEGAMTAAMKSLATVPEAERKEHAKNLNEWKLKLTAAIDAKRGALSRPSESELQSKDAIDVTLELPRSPRGHLHLIPEFIRHVEEVFGRMGFDVSYGPEIETEDMNFNMLNIPADHPARDAQDTFWIKGAKNMVLRTHTSPVQIRYMLENKPPFRMICPGKVYRKDADATHSPMFHQWEGLMIGKDVSLANMKAVMIEAIKALVGPDVEFRFRTGYFPFVEPGLEVDVRWQGTGSREGPWLEIVGCGMVNPNVLKNCKIDPTKWQGFAFGFGVERMIMIKHRIPDIRSLYEGDPRFLRQF